MKTRFTLFMAGCILGILLTEIILRVAGFSYPTFGEVNDYLGGSLLPKSSFTWTKEGNAFIKINGAGFRDVEHAMDKPKDTIRVAVLGDSYVEALQVPLEQTFWSVMQNKLKNCRAFSGKNVEVLAFGVSGFGTAQELLMLQHYVWNYSPDVVVLAFTVGNDVRNNSRALEPDKMRPFFVHQSGQLVLDTSFRNSRIFRFRKTLSYRLFRQLRAHLRILQFVTSIRARIKEMKSAGLEEAGLDDQVYHKPVNSNWAEAWKITDELLQRLHHEVSSHHAQLMVVTVSSGIQVFPDPAIRQAFMQKLGVKDLFYPNHRLITIGEKYGIKVLDLAPAFQRYADQNHVFFHGFSNTAMGSGHWNQAGHALAGDMISSELCRFFATCAE